MPSGAFGMEKSQKSAQQLLGDHPVDRMGPQAFWVPHEERVSC